MTNYWNQADIPHKGWCLIDVIDIHANVQHADEDEAEFEKCMMCGQEKIRYVHIVKHSKIDKEFRVGCVCAEKMTDDYLNPKLKQRELKNKATRRRNWVNRKWKISAKGNSYLNIENHNIVIFKDKFSEKFKVKIDETIGCKFFDDIEEAKIASFNGIEYYKEQGEW